MLRSRSMRVLPKKQKKALQSPFCVRSYLLLGSVYVHGQRGAIRGTAAEATRRNHQALAVTTQYLWGIYRVPERYERTSKSASLRHDVIYPVYACFRQHSSSTSISMHVYVNKLRYKGRLSDRVKKTLGLRPRVAPVSRV